jgi:DNA-binding transcriptional ArsR family regulator
MSWAFKQHVEPGPKLVLLALADHANGQTGLCIPGQKSLAEQCSMSVRTVQRHIQVLEDGGLLRREARMRGQGRGRTSDRYYLGDQGDKSAPMRRDVTTNATNQDDQCDTVGVAEPEENRKKEPLAAEPRKRQPDILFEALATATRTDIGNLTRTERGQLNKATAELREIGATPEQVLGKAKAWAKQYPNANLTPTALVKHWSTLDHRTSRSVWDDYTTPEEYY